MPRVQKQSPVKDKTQIEFLDVLGKKVRKERNRLGITRKELALLSSTSERYLAQIECGTGNLSILVLRQIAQALKMPLSFFLAEEPFEPELLHIVEKIKRHCPDKLPQIIAMADQYIEDIATGSFDLKQQRVALLGLRGAGKSTLAKIISQKMNLPLLELTQEIEAESGLDIAEIYSLYGEQGYRELESQCLKKVVKNHQQVIIAVAGGITANSDTFNDLLFNFHTIWLKASPEEHMMRVLDQGDRRPVRDDPAAMTSLRNILSSRESQYAKADVTLDTSKKSVKKSSSELFNIIKKMPLEPSPD